MFYLFIFLCKILDQSNSSVEKAGILGSMLMRLLPVDKKCCLRGETLKKAIQEDLEKGLIPCYVIATLGTTGICAFDNLDEIGPICKEYNIWLHVDAAYAGECLCQCFNLLHPIYTFLLSLYFYFILGNNKLRPFTFQIIVKILLIQKRIKFGLLIIR